MISSSMNTVISPYEKISTRWVTVWIFNANLKANLSNVSATQWEFPIADIIALFGDFYPGKCIAKMVNT